MIPLLSLKSGKVKFKINSKVRDQRKVETNGKGLNQPSSDGGSETRNSSTFDGSYSSGSQDGISLRNKGERAVIGAGGAPEMVQRAFECENELLNSECILIHESNTARLFFKVLDQKASKIKGGNVYNILQCANISAGDVKVSTKFGSWDTMVARLLIECDGPLLLWKQKDASMREESLEKDSSKHIEYEYKILSSCMVKATFSVEFVSVICKMMHLVKVAKTREIVKVKELQKSGEISRQAKVPSKIREGLPEWVNYIPYRWYSANLRRFIEYLLVFYTILSLLWAVWQLYRHVDFIQAYLKPFVIFIEHYFSILKSWFQYLDSLFIVLSHYWWHYIKPLLMILVAAFSPIFQIFRPLKGIINVIPHLFDPFIQFFQMVYIFLKPVFIPLKSAFGFGGQLIVSVFNTIALSLMRNPTIANIIHRGQEFYLVQLVYEAMHGHLDPLKAQVVVVRDLIFKSSRKIYYGLRFIVNKTYFMVLFLRREREYLKEGENCEADANKAEIKEKVD